MLETIITVVHVVLAIILVAVVLLQSGKSAGLSAVAQKHFLVRIRQKHSMVCLKSSQLF